MPNPPDRAPRGHNGRVTVRREVAISAGLSTATLLAIGLGGFVVARAVATHEAVLQAQQATELLARAVIEPAIDEGLTTGDEASIQRLDEVVQANVLGDRILAARVWSADGTVLYTDDLSTIGQRFPLDDEKSEALATGRSHAELSDLTKDENSEQSDFDQLLEVYVPLTDPEDRPLLFETYQTTEQIAASTGRITRAFAPLVLGGLLLLGLISALLSWRLARRLERAQDERERLLQEALVASEHERRTIAADLHDGVVQDLVGVTYALDALGADPAEAGNADALAGAAATTRRSVRSLRSLLVEIYPPNLDQVGLAGALADLVAAGSAGLPVALHIDPELALTPASRDAVYRTAREALSNVRRHARATRAEVRVEAVPGDRVQLTVSDDGVGFDPGQVASGHVGLRLLDDLAGSIGGRLAIDSTPGRGTTVTLEVPR